METVLSLKQGLIAAIKHEMFRHKLEVPDLAAALGMSASGVYKLLAGTVELRPDEIEKLARLFRVSPAKLLGGPVARDRATIHEAFEVLQEEYERIAKQPDLSRVPADILSRLPTCGDAEWAAFRVAVEGIAIGKEHAKTVRNKGLKRKHAATD